MYPGVASNSFLHSNKIPRDFNAINSGHDVTIKSIVDTKTKRAEKKDVWYTKNKRVSRPHKVGL